MKKTLKDADIKADTAFEGYRGKKRWYVKAPGRNEIVVAALDEASAIAAAAAYWGEVWTSYNFYAYCDVRRAYQEERAKK